MPGEFRANIHLGGTASVIKSNTKKNVLLSKRQSYGFKVAGVDIIRSSKVLYY
jgi:ribosomal protein S6--L-glutamate ligase